MLFEVPCRDKVDSWTSLWVAQAKRPSCITSSPWFSFLQNTSNKTYIFFFSLLIFTQRQSRSHLLSSHWNEKQVYMSKYLVLSNLLWKKCCICVPIPVPWFVPSGLRSLYDVMGLYIWRLWVFLFIQHIPDIACSYFGYSAVGPTTPPDLLFANHFPMEIANKVLITAKWRV